MSRAFKLALIVTACLMQTRTEAQTISSQSKFIFKHFDTKDGLASEFAYSLAQDSLGFIWVQYAFGLSRYDGYRFKIYRHNPQDSANSLPNVPLGRLITDHSGNLWITVHTQEGSLKLTRYDIKKDAFISYSPNVSGSFVSKIEFEKKTRNIWLGLVQGKGLCRFNPVLSQTDYFINKKTDSSGHSDNSMIYDIADRDSLLLLATDRGLWIFNKLTETFVRPEVDFNDQQIIYRQPIRDIYENPHETWLLLDSIMIRIDSEFSIEETINLPEVFQIKTYDRDLQFNTYTRDGNGKFWFATRNNGVYRLDPTDGSFTNITSDPRNPQSLRTNTLNGILVDKDNNIWVATHRGISQLADQSITFHNFRLPGAVIDVGTVHKTNALDYIVINSNKQNTDQEILVTPLNPGDPTILKFKKLASVKGIAIHAFWTGRNYFWISSYSGGIVGLPINKTTGIIEGGAEIKLTHDPKNKNTLSSDLTGGILEDTDGNLWIGTRGGGLNKVNTKLLYGTDGSVERYRRANQDSNSLSSDIVWDVYPSGDKSILVVTERTIDRYHNGRFSAFSKNKLGHAIHQTSAGKTYVAGGTGLYEIREENGKQVSTRIPSLANEDLRAIQADTLGRLWLSTTEGVICYDPVENIILKFNEDNGVGHPRAINVFKRTYLTSRGNIVISDPDGLTLFDPHTLRINRTKTNPQITGLLVSNKPVAARVSQTASENFNVDRSIQVLDKLILDHLNNNFSVEFSAMQMTSPKQNQYRHKLEDYDREWIETDSKNRIASYTNLDAGTYVLRIKASNHHGVWNDEERRLQVIILPPPWETWWAYTFYGLFFLVLILFWQHYDIKRAKLKHRTEQLSELDKLKTKFFANISHEFRTPVTLLLGPLQDFYKTSKDENQKHTLRLMIKNGERLLHLINQLLDLSKIEAGKMKLHIRQVDIVPFIRDIMSSYESLASEKKIKYFFHAERHQLFVYMDPEKIEKVIHNLLSNAFKFTTSGGEIIVHLHSTDRHSIVSVKDSGVGIPTKDIEKIFDRFTRSTVHKHDRMKVLAWGWHLPKRL